ncbi:hypothetical protein EGW08_008167 [Elysia chlorotica]|uniref:Globin n=1 Tax=Elysia chlorotica TaxID=188477 RepID=A0A3S1BM45_ELYCH|nr:hypothetical protein EGW08_008167 [Elysia chlorotica]
MTCPVTGLTEEMFDNIPNMRSRFHKIRASSSRTTLIADDIFLAHTQTVILSLDLMVKVLYNPSKLKKKLLLVAKSHVGRNPPVGSDYFDPFADNFHFFMQSTLGLPEDDPEVQAWAKFLYVLSDLVRTEEVALAKQNKTTVHHNAPCCHIL